MRRRLSVRGHVSFRTLLPIYWKAALIAFVAHIDSSVAFLGQPVPAVSRHQLLDLGPPVPSLCCWGRREPQSTRSSRHHSPFTFFLFSPGSSLRDEEGTRLEQHNRKTHRAPNRRTQLRWIAQSVEKIQKDEASSSTTTNCQQQLLEGLHKLAAASSQKQVLDAGRLLESLPISETESFSVLERVTKAVAMTGLLSLALNLTDSMLHQGYLPSAVTQDALCNSLRKAGRVTALERVLERLGKVAVAQSTATSLASFNTYLASLCDVVTMRDSPSSRKTVRKQRSDCLDQAQQWLQSDRAQRKLGLVPDVVSYTTVLHTAAAVANRTLVDALWNGMISRGIAPTPNAYNARLRVAGKLRHDEQQEALQVWKEIQATSHLRPDRYTIDFMLLPLVRAGRVLEVERILDQFVLSNSESIVSDAFAVFLLTLVKGGEVDFARTIFDTYVLPGLSPVVVGSAVSRMVRPTVRHFNVLIDGYSRMAREAVSAWNETDNELEAAREQQPFEAGWELYELMLESSSIQPDSYTVTSMVFLCPSSLELSRLIAQAVQKLGVECKSAVLRAAITAYGDLNDPSSAVWLFAAYIAYSTQTRNWNVLAGALAKGAAIGNGAVLDISNAQAKRVLKSNDSGDALHALSKLLNGLSCPEAAKVLLDLMNAHLSLPSVSVPVPDSQTYCLAATALQYGRYTDSNLAVELFRNATKSSIPADGRFVNALFRCFGDGIDGALAAWKEVRNTRSLDSQEAKNLVAAYNGLLYVTGRALRPDVALRIVYAMNKEGLEPDEVSLNCYRSGRRVRQQLQDQAGAGTTTAPGSGLNFGVASYESLLSVECTKYDSKDKRRAGEKRVRIIM